MGLLGINRNPSERHLRQFGWCALAALALLGWARTGWAPPAAWDSSQRVVIAWLLTAGALLAGLGQFRPRALRPLFVMAALITLPLGMVLGEVILVVVFFFVFTPMAVLFRLIGRDSLRRRREPTVASYWLPRAQPQDPLQYYRQS
jgi:hypothetical protein